MDALVRSIWIVRGWTGGTVLATALVGAITAPCGPTWLALVIAGAVVGAGCLATLRFSRAFRAGDAGEVLMKAGPRIPRAAFQGVHAADRAEVIAAVLVTLLVAAGPPLVGLPEPWIATGFGAVTVTLNVLIWRQRRWSHALMDGLWVYQSYDFEAAAAALRPAIRAPVEGYRDAARGLLWHVRVARGERDAVLRETEAAWDGTLDDRAATLGLLRAGAGDRSLLVRYLAASREVSTRYERYLEASCRGYLLLLEGRWDEAVAAVREPIDVPDWYLRQLKLVEIAALQGAGRTDEVRAALGALSPGLEVEAWRKLAHATQWGLLEDASAGRTTAALRPGAPLAAVAVEPAPTDQPFAPPRTRPVARPVRRAAGAIPLESMVLAARRGRGEAALLTVLSLVLVLLCPLLVALVLLVRMLGDHGPVLEVAGLVSPLGLTLAMLVLADVGLARHGPGEGPTVVLSDGRQVAERWFSAWSFATILRLLAMTLVVFAVFSLAEGIDARTPWMWVLGVPFGLLMLYAARVRWIAAQLVRAVHFLPVEQAVAVAEGSRAATGTGRGWLALARLWAGDADGAEQAAREATLILPELGWIEGWLRAGRGEVDLQRVLAEADPDTLGERYRRAVLVAVAALRAGASARVVDRLDDWTDVAEQLPNRYGALLARLVAGVRRANGQTVGVDANPELAWVSRVWPFVP